MPTLPTLKSRPRTNRRHLTPPFSITPYKHMQSTMYIIIAGTCNQVPAIIRFVDLCVARGLQYNTNHNKKRLFATEMVGNGEAQTTFGTTTCKHFATIGCRHSFAETMLVNSLSVRRLESSFHLIILFLFYYPLFGVQI